MNPQANTTPCANFDCTTKLRFNAAMLSDILHTRGYATLTCPVCGTPKQFGAPRSESRAGELVTRRAGKSELVHHRHTRTDLRQRIEPTFDLDVWSQQNAVTWNKIRQPVPFPAVELREVDFMCSRFFHPFQVTFVKREMGDLFRVCSLGDAQKYRQLLEQTGRRIEQRGQRLGAMSDYDLAGFQCAHCYAGGVTGSTSDFVLCHDCNTLGCAGSLQPIANGGLTYICPHAQCNPKRRAGVIGQGYVQMITANNLLGVQS